MGDPTGNGLALYSSLAANANYPTVYLPERQRNHFLGMKMEIFRDLNRSSEEENENVRQMTIEWKPIYRETRLAPARLCLLIRLGPQTPLRSNHHQISDLLFRNRSLLHLRQSKIVDPDINVLQMEMRK
jgi:hypothetical protein